MTTGLETRDGLTTEFTESRRIRERERERERENVCVRNFRDCSIETLQQVPEQLGNFSSQE